MIDARNRAPIAQQTFTQGADRTPNVLALLAIAWVLGAGTVVVTRFRGEWELYRALHRWAAAHGVPDVLRNFDSLILCVAAAFVGARIVARSRGGKAGGWLRLRGGRPGWGIMVPLALVPMLVGGAALGWARTNPGADFAALLPKLVGGVIRAPIAEEMLFRGLLVAVCAAAIGWRGTRFWCNATMSAALFAATHVSWTAEAFADGWATLLVTGAGGLWYGWLLARWRSLWVPMILHAGMNLGWALAAAGGGAGGGGWIENLLRVATIVIATWWTVRRTRTEDRSEHVDTQL